MIQLFRKVLVNQLKGFVKSYPDRFLNLYLPVLKANPQILQRLFKEMRPELVACAEDYPSVINNGFLHIEKVVELVHFFKLDPTHAIVDVGGAGGVISVMFSEAFKQAKVYAFEPIKNTFQSLKTHTQNYKNILPINKGLGSQPDLLTIHLASRITSSSLFPIEADIQNDFFAENLKEQGSEQVVISTLDSEIPSNEHINVIKIDVQGFELEVLRGAVQALKRTAIVVLEMQNHELYVNAPKYYVLDEYLREQGFNLYNIVPSIRQHKKLYEYDGIYVNNNISGIYNT